MKKHLFFLVGLLGLNSVSHAVSVNEHGLGQVLLFPFYTAVSGNDTYINVANKTDQVKAVKVRFREGMNGQVVLDFNVYLSPFDHWSGVVFSNNIDMVFLQTGDTSCTVPAIPGPGGGVTMAIASFAADSVNDRARAGQGYVEVIEMGVVTGSLAEDATHVDKTIDLTGWPTKYKREPADCAALTAAWNSGVWASDPTVDMQPASGGLSGYGVLINVTQGTDASYNAVALNGFASDKILHGGPGSATPSLNDADPVAKLIDNGTFYQIETATGIDAVSAVLMKNTISNDYVLEPTINAGTDWVMTFPTKHEYVNEHIDADGQAVALAPFTMPWNAESSSACEDLTKDRGGDITPVRFYDREQNSDTPSNFSFGGYQPTELCTETSILSFNGSDVLGSLASGSSIGVPLYMNEFNNGWMEIDFKTIADPMRTRELKSVTHTLSGLPIIGFAVQKYVNHTLHIDGESILSNYAGAVNHNATRKVTTP